LPIVGTVREMVDPLAAPQQAQLIARITQRVLRGVQLGEWDLTSHPVDDGSSLALDDQDFMPDLGPRLVSSTARFPAMNASENIVAAGQVFSTAFAQDRKLRTASIATLCRSAVEASAKTIWLLSGSSREVRRARCVGSIECEREYQSKDLDVEEATFAIRTDEARHAEYQWFQQRRAEFNERQEAIASLPESARERPPGVTGCVSHAAEWIDANPPADPFGELSSLGMTLLTKSFYPVGSSFIEGLRWVREYMQRDADLLRLTLTGFATAVIMTECAVALIEAQSVNAASAGTRAQNYPPGIASTVATWSARYPRF
jgi:hypothetical protein